MLGMFVRACSAMSRPTSVLDDQSRNDPNSSDFLESFFYHPTPHDLSFLSIPVNASLNFSPHQVDREMNE